MSHPTAAALRDIEELKTKIGRFKAGEIDEDRFKHYRLTRGVYGQRQLGVHMFRTKIPFGKLTARQLVALANASEHYTNGNLHFTTRQNVQFHYVKLEDSVGVWEDLTAVGVTAREACGNTVRNVTASPRAGIDPDEAFDVTPYVQATFEHFLRNPVSQAMGRKIKIAFSATEHDTAFTYFHDFGFIPRLRVAEDGDEIRGFKVVVAGGLGAQSIPAQLVTEFMPEEEILPFMQAAIRVFDRYGEREKRMKARMKYLVKALGLEAFLELVAAERAGLTEQTVWVDRTIAPTAIPAPPVLPEGEPGTREPGFLTWQATNVFEQKQAGFHGVNIRVPLGNLDANRARLLAEVVRRYAADDVRITVQQGLLLRYVRAEALPHLYRALKSLDLGLSGANSTADVTACPGTDTCNLGVTNSTGAAEVLEDVVRDEFPELVHDRHFTIKISGCMNACGQHMAASVGLHGSSIKRAPLVIPAMQVVLGGGVDAAGVGWVAERVIKLPTKRTPDALRFILRDFLANRTDEQERFDAYFRRRGKPYFYDMLKPLASLKDAGPELAHDWGQDSDYVQAIGVGECAGVAYDMVGAIIGDQRERIEWAGEAIAEGLWEDAIYHTYTAFVTGAKALLLGTDVHCNTQARILEDFDRLYVSTGTIAGLSDDAGEGAFERHVLRMKTYKPTEEFADSYLADGKTFFAQVIAEREAQLRANAPDEPVVASYYNA